MHGIEEWPLIDEYGMDISPSSYTKVAITEVSLISCQIQSLLIVKCQINIIIVLINSLHFRQNWKGKRNRIHPIAPNPGTQLVSMK